MHTGKDEKLFWAEEGTVLGGLRCHHRAGSVRHPPTRSTNARVALKHLLE